MENLENGQHYKNVINTYIIFFGFCILALSETGFACEYLTKMCNLSEVPINLLGNLKLGHLGKMQRNLEILTIKKHQNK